VKLKLARTKTFGKITLFALRQARVIFPLCGASDGSAKHGSTNCADGLELTVETDPMPIRMLASWKGN
jgi:hypothetical protein